MLPLTMDTKIFKLLLQDRYLGANRFTATEELLVVPPHTTERNVAFEPQNGFVVILRKKVKHSFYSYPMCTYDVLSCTSSLNAIHNTRGSRGNLVASSINMKDRQA